MGVHADILGYQKRLIKSAPITVPQTAADAMPIKAMAARRASQSGHGLDDQREAVGEIVARPAHLGAVLARDDTEAVTLDFVQTHPARRRRLSFHRETRHDKSGRAEHAYTRPGDNGGGSLGRVLIKLQW